MPIGFAIAGAGYIAEAHAAILASLPGTTLRAVHSIMPAEAQALALKYKTD